MVEIILAVMIGGIFGFTLDRIGATNPGLIIKMLNFRDLHLMKTILLGIGISSVLLFTGLLTGLVDPGHLSIKATYTGVFIGGLLLGGGFAVSGFCPGTGLAAAATGRKDALFFVIGGLAGAGVYMAVYSAIANGMLLETLGGKATLGKIAGTDYPAVLASPSGEIIGLVLGLMFIFVSIGLPKRIGIGAATVAGE